MGGGASHAVPDKMDRDFTKAYCGDKFDPKAFDSMKAEDGTITREQFFSASSRDLGLKLPGTVAPVVPGTVIPGVLSDVVASVVARSVRHQIPEDDLRLYLPAKEYCTFLGPFVNLIR